jgi:uncharacterized membrane protein
VRVRATIEISAPAEAVWELVNDPTRYLEFMSGITRWEVQSDHPTGLGARYRMLLLVGSAEIGGLIEVVEWNEASDLAWTSVTGIDQRGRWRLRERSRGRTHVELRLSYGVAGSGLSGWLSERIASPIVSGHLRRSVQQLKRQVEHEQLRARAAERRKARAAA